MIRRQAIQLIILAIIFLFGLHYFLETDGIPGGKSFFNLGSRYGKDEFRMDTHGVGNEHMDDFPTYSDGTKNTTRIKACFVVLVRNGDIHDLRWTMRQLEDRFNRKYNYPYVFLNDVDFTDEFKELSQSMTKAETHYGLIPKEHWSVPDNIDEARAAKTREEMGNAGVLYGNSLPYRHMCRFESGFFFRHHLLDQFDYYWRIEPSVEFYCDIDYDPFRFMQENGKKYGWTISLFEYLATIETLWSTVKKFKEKHPEHIREGNLEDWISNDGGQTYNLCHFWSNFEIADLNLWRSKAYLDFFEFLDDSGGFFYERWGDAPVHSIAAALLLKKEEIHWFRDIGYKHNPFTHCPEEKEMQLKCHCDPKENFDWNGYSCTTRYLQVGGST
jgi:alpha 1,2-mannosyltransferase